MYTLHKDILTFRQTPFVKPFIFVVKIVGNSSKETNFFLFFLSFAYVDFMRMNMYILMHTWIKLQALSSAWMSAGVFRLTIHHE